MLREEFVGFERQKFLALLIICPKMYAYIDFFFEGFSVDYENGWYSLIQNCIDAITKN